MPRIRQLTEQAALAQLVLAAQGLAAHHVADLATRPEPVPEYFEHPALGLQANALMAPVALLNGLARAVAVYAKAKDAPPAKPVRTNKPLAASGCDC